MRAYCTAVYCCVLLFTVDFVLIAWKQYGTYYNFVQTIQNQTNIRKKTEVKPSSHQARLHLDRDGVPKLIGVGPMTVNIDCELRPNKDRSHMGSLKMKRSFGRE